jgi:hypothetical protein
MKSMYLFAILVFNLGWTPLASADGDNSPCSTLKECEELKEKVEAQIKALTPVYPTVFMDVEKNADGTPLALTQADALKYCKNKGGHLPSIKEMMDWALAQGAAPILSMQDVLDKYEGDVPADYNLIKTVTVDGTSEVFYYNLTGYKPSKVAVENGWFWTSSFPKNDSSNAIIFYSSLGKIIYAKNYQNMKSSVRCATGATL